VAHCCEHGNESPSALKYGGILHYVWNFSRRTLLHGVSHKDGRRKKFSFLFDVTKSVSNLNLM
jgi:hypothetical protein